MPVAGPALLLAGAILAWRTVVTVRAARTAARRWTIRAALQWTLVLVAVDAGLIGAALLGPARLSELLPASVAGFDPRGARAAELLLAVALATAVRRVPVRRTSLYGFVLARIERETYDRADDWIYRVACRTVPANEMKPLLHAIRADLERRSDPRAGLDAAYVAALTGPGRTPSREDLRAACHRMLARGERRRLVRLVAEHSGPLAPERPAKPDDEAVWVAEEATERLLADLSPPTDVVRADIDADIDADALRWAGAIAASGGQHESAASGGQQESLVDTSVDVSVYVRVDDEPSADRVFRAVDALARIVGDAERG
jgi:hypothetical protein